MIKSQVQIPDELYRETKRMADDYEMSFAEVVLRSLERTLPAYPPKDTGWRVPAALPFTSAELRGLRFASVDIRLNEAAEIANLPGIAR